jgi:hypothetical protein
VLRRTTIFKITFLLLFPPFSFTIIMALDEKMLEQARQDYLASEYKSI